MRRRRAITIFVTAVTAICLLAGAMPAMIEQTVPPNQQVDSSDSTTPKPNTSLATQALEKLPIKGRAPKTGYERAQFGNGWAKVNGCSSRDIILHRDLEQVEMSGECKVVKGVLRDPYTAKTITFTKDNASSVQIDHVVALSDAWQKGAQQLTAEQRKQLANDPLELIAVDGPANQQKSDGDAATWLPKNKAFRCEYVARQIAIKIKYLLWVTRAEYDAMQSVLRDCPLQVLP